MAAMVTLRLLGRFELAADGGVIPASPSVERLLALLALEDPRRRRVIAGRLWPDSGDANAMASLRTTVWRVRSLAPVPVLASSGPALSLAPGVCVDLTAALAAPSGDGRWPGGERCEELLGLPLLPGWYEDWLTAQQLHWDLVRVERLEAASQRVLEAGDAARAVALAAAAIEADPLRDTAWQAVIKAQMARGNTGSAVRSYRAYLELMRHEGLPPDPSPAMRALISPALAPG